MSSDLPAGWVWARFSDVARIAANLVDPAKWPHLPHIAPDNIERGTGTLLPYRTVQEDGVTSAKHRFHPGQLLYSKIRPYLNKCIRAEFDGLCSADMYPVDAFISAGFLHYFMLTRQFVGAVSKAAGSRTILPKTNQAQMSNLPVPVAPLPEQLRIVDAVDSYVTRLDAAERSLREARRRLKAYRASVLKAAVEGRLVPTEAELARKEGRSYEQATVLLERILQERRRRWEEAELARMKAAGKVPQDDKWKARYSEPEPVNTLELPVLPTGWAWARVSSVGTVQLGRQRAPQHHRGPHMRPYLRVANVFEDQIDTSDVMSMNFSPEEFEVYRLEHGDILLNEGQSPHLVGRPAMYRGEVAGACFQNTLVRFKASSGIVPDYALTVFRAQLHARRYMRIAQITTNIAHLGAGRFAEVEFPVPPLLEQQRIVTEVERLMTVADAIDQSLGHERLRCARLRQSILAWAFDGRLVDQDPLDESADALLDRIRAERVVAPVAKPKQKRSRKLKAAS